ncbi:AraC family transcriptional regulator [Streptomyces apricus]|uniref:AraC family transcriptional regulator n=1 Tax=Streptomyces apricus TaxID=1828112 RepID=A0A5A9ZXB0_9ACTN|nr:AraC family transcriptional regulator [Streptomyces apricus]KAA0921890.1 AraC family transcriptional regulator [Streptomyces apricus]
MLDDLAQAIARYRGDMWSDTAVPRQRLVTLDEPVTPLDMLYEPMVCFVVQGSKTSVAGDLRWTSGPGQIFLNSLVLPVTATFEEVPYRSAVLRLDADLLTELLLELDPEPVGRDAARSASPEPAGQISAPMTPELTDAVTRWVRLLDTPQDIRALAGPVETEILYRLLGTSLAPTLRHFTVADSAAARVRTAARWISARYSEPLGIDEIAATAHMSTASLHRHFKAATGMSPLRFQKHLRLQEARRLLLAGDTTAALVAERVGYVSATQFNREYRRAYGLPPVQDTTRLRGRLAEVGQGA